jgi:outer membrane lipoprotein-sorting protein
MKTIRFLFLASIWLFAQALQAQTTPATPEQQAAMLETLTAASRTMESLTCTFEQTKSLSILDGKVVSRGRMYYVRSDRLRWEYTSPYVYTFILNDNRILMQTDGSRTVVDVRQNRLFQEIVRVMVGGVNGSGLTDGRNFSSRYYRGAKTWEVVLEPLKKEMKQLFAVIKLSFNVMDYTVDRVEMQEPGGDTTVILLTDKIRNSKIEDKLFDID